MRFNRSRRNAMQVVASAALAVLMALRASAPATAENVFGGTLPTTTVLPSSALSSTSSTDVSSLEKTLSDKRKKIEEIQKKIQQYQNDIAREQGRALTLKTQLSIVRSRIQAATLRIEETKEKIAANDLERKEINGKLTQTQEKLKNNKQFLAHLLRIINSEQNRSLVEVVVAEPTLSSYFDALQGTKQRQKNLSELVDNVESLIQTYQLQQAALSQKHVDLRRLEEESKERSFVLQSEETTKNVILTQSQQSERRFQQFLNNARAEELDADQEIRSLESTIRQRLQERGLSSRLSPDGSISFSWPTPNKGIAAYFHDPDYPFRNIFEHPAIDIRTLINGKSSNGLPVRAAASGYVARARDAGMGYSYIMLIHNNQFSTVYGHVSQINVKQDEFVTQGQVIALSGGQPGTPGAGKLTTGPHLHFEVRKNGIPVNPLDYLP